MSAVSAKPPRVTHRAEALIFDDGVVDKRYWHGLVTFKAHVGDLLLRLEFEQSADSKDESEGSPDAFLSFHPNGCHTAADCLELVGPDMWPMLQGIEALIGEARKRYPTLMPRALARAKAAKEKALSRPRQRSRAGR